MSRTDEVRDRGRERGGSGGGAPFVKWGEDYAWLEGRVVGSFQTKYGLAVTFDVTGTGGAGLEAQGRDDDGEQFTTSVKAGDQVNFGTQSAALQGKIVAEDEGKAFHVAFEGWEHPKGGNRYRVFTVIELEEREAQVAGAGQGQGATMSDPDDDLPF